MNLIASTEPVNKRLKCENKYEDKLYIERKKEQLQDIMKTTYKKEKHPYEEIQEQESNEKLVNNDDAISTVIHSDDEFFTFPPDENISDMLEEVQYSGHFPTVTDRYFTAYYKMNVQSPGDDICIRIHSNRICMLTLAPSHIILQGDKDIEKINFKVSDKLNRALNKVSGKGKHGAQPLQANSNICTVSCSDGQTYSVKCCMIGKLVEVNEMLSEKPQLLREPPHKGGYLALILPNLRLLENLKQSLLTQEQYIDFVKKRDQQHGIKNNTEVFETHNS